MPPIPLDIVRTSIVWNLPGGEIAVNTLHFKHLHQAANTLDWEGDMTQRYANLPRDAIFANWTSLKNMFSSNVSLNRVDAYHLDGQGFTIDKRTALFAGATAAAGTGSTGMLPGDVAACLSLYGYDPSGYDPLGARKRGRIFLPGLSVSLCSTAGRFGAVSSYLNEWRKVVDYMQNRPMDAGTTLRERAQLVVLSRRFGVATPVTHCSMDDLFDTQRRRENALIPLRSQATVTPQS